MQIAASSHFAAGKDRAAGDAELVIAPGALELAARGDLVCIAATAFWAHGFTVRPANALERLVGRFFTALVDFPQRQGPSRCAE